MRFLRQRFGADRGKGRLGRQFRFLCNGLRTFCRTRSNYNGEPKAPELGEDDRAKFQTRGRGARATRSRSGRERSSAATRLARLRIHKYEALLHQRLLIIQGHAMQVDERLRINKHPHIAI